jgi:hypothetical protein
MYISSNGNVGIGTQTPTQPLQVAISGSSTIGGTSLSGSALLVGTINNGIGIDNNELYNAGNEFIIGTLGSNNISFRPNSTPRMVISSSGDVGIGITIPTAKLHVNNLNANNSFLVEDDTNPDATPFVIDSIGRVGIGTGSAFEKVTIQNGNIALKDLTNSTPTSIVFTTSDTSSRNYINTLNSSSATDDYMKVGSWFGSVHLTTGNITSPTTHLFVSRSGNIGVGITSSLNAKLHVNNTGTENSFLVEDSTNPDSSPFVIDAAGNVAIGQTSSSSGIKLTVNGPTLLNNNYLLWVYDGASNNDYIVSNDSPHSGSGNTPGFYVFKHDSTLSTASGSGNSTLDAGSIWMNNSTQTNYIAGNVGIGTTTPNARLDISGSTIITGSLNVTAGITASAFATNDALITSTTTTINSGITTIYNIPTASYDGAWFDYTIRSGSNARAGSIMGMWSGTAVNYAETTTTDFGNTSGFALGMSIVGANMILSSSATTNGWTFNAIIRSV